MKKIFLVALAAAAMMTSCKEAKTEKVTTNAMLNYVMLDRGDPNDPLK